MGLKIRPQALPHLFMPGETVTAAIKKYNLYQAEPVEMDELIAQFKAINSSIVPRPGTRALIPIIPRLQEQVFAGK